MTTNAHESNGSWRSTSNPVGAALATSAGRRGTLFFLAGASLFVTAITLFGRLGAPLEMDTMKVVTGAAGVMSFIALMGGAVTVGAQVGVDRANGTLDQYRLAGVAPRSLLRAYLLGPQWLLLVLQPAAALPVVANFVARHEYPVALWTLAAFAAVTLAQLALSTISLSFALALPRASLTPPANAGAPGFLVVLVFIAVSLVGGVVAREHHQTGAVVVAAVLLALGLARTVGLALKRLERDQAPEASPVATLALVARRLGLVACGAVMTGPSVHADAIFLHALVAFGVTVVTVLVAMPSRAATFRRWARGAANEATPWALGAAAVALAAAEIVGVSATRQAFSARAAGECALVLGAMALAAIESERGASLRQQSGVTIGALVVGGVLFGTLRAVLAVTGAVTAASVFDAANPLAVAAGPSATAWSPVARVGLALAVAVMAVRSARRAGEEVRARALAAVEPSVG